MTTQNAVFSPGTSSLWKDVEEEEEDLSERLRKTLYYGKLPGTDRPSLPLTDLAVNFFQEAAPRELGKLDTYLAASTSRSACMSPASMTVGMMYVQRLHRRRPDYLSQISSSELFLISMMMASKFLYDEGIDDEVFNDEWALSGDVETEDVNELERDFLNAIDWQLFVRPEDFGEMLQHVEKRIALQEGLKRGWFSYTDMMILSHDLKLMDWTALASELSKVFSAASLAYFAGILTMVGSTMLGTTTSAAMINLGSTVLPLCLKMTSPFMALTLYPEISSKVNMQGSRPLQPGLPMLRSEEILDLNGTDAHFLADVELMDQVHRDVKDTVQGQGQSSMTFDLANDPEEIVTKTTAKNPSKDTNSLLNSLLPPFLALLTLKDSVLNYAFGAKQLMEEDSTTFEDDLESSSNDLDKQQQGRRVLPPTTTRISEFCSNGPCLLDSWPDCWNISSDKDWAEYQTYTTRCCRDAKPCCNKCIINANSNLDLHSTLTFDSADGHLNTNIDSDSSVKCCCRFSQSEASSWLKDSLDSTNIVDLNLRFLTQSMYPILITT